MKLHLSQVEMAQSKNQSDNILGRGVPGLMLYNVRHDLPYQ